MTCQYTSAELAEALRRSLMKEGRMDEAEAASRINKEEALNITKTGGTEALALIIKADLTKDAYQTIRYFHT